LTYIYIIVLNTKDLCITGLLAMANIMVASDKRKTSWHYGSLSIYVYGFEK